MTTDQTKPSQRYKQYRQEHYEANKSKYEQWRQEWVKRNPEHLAAYRINYYTTKRINKFIEQKKTLEEIKEYFDAELAHALATYERAIQLLQDEATKSFKSIIE